MPIVTSIGKTDEDKIYDYCRTFCNFVEEHEMAKSIKYNAKTKQILFNNCINIHPRSFFHLQDIEKFIEALKNYSNPETGQTDEENDNKFLNDLKLNKSSLRDTKKRERIEYWPLRKKCLRELGKILHNNFNSIQNFLPSIFDQLTDKEEEEYNIENVKVKDEYIFKEGVTNDFVDDKIELKYKIDEILVGLKIASMLDNEYKCKNLFDFQSILETIKEYSNGKHNEGERMCKSVIAKMQLSIADNKQISAMFEAFNAELKKIKLCQQEFEKKLIFSNPLKGLHHWYKHGEDFENLHDYYQKMNEFFSTCTNPEKLLDTQDGLKLMSSFKNSHFFGALVKHEKIDKTSVATFYKIKKSKTLKYKKFDTKISSEYVLLTDVEFPLSETEIELNKKIMVKKDTIKKMMETLQRLPKTFDITKVLKILILYKTNPEWSKEDTHAEIEPFARKCKEKLQNEKSRALLYSVTYKGEEVILVGGDTDTIYDDSYAGNCGIMELQDWKKFIETILFK